MIQSEIHENGPIRFDGATEPTVRLIDEPIFEVIDANRAERRLGEVKDLVTLRRPLAGDQIGLVIAVEVNLVGPVPDLFTFFEFSNNVRIASCRHERREPVETRYYAVFDLASWYPAGPPDDHWSAE